MRPECHTAPRRIGASASRVYLACIWGYGSSDAGGGYFGNAVSASDLNAAAKFVVVGER